MQAAFGLLEESLGDAEAAGTSFEFDRDSGGKDRADGLERFQLLALGGMPIEQRTGSSMQRGGFAGFVGRREDVEARSERAKANGIAKAADVGEFESVEDHEFTSRKV